MATFDSYSDLQDKARKADSDRRTAIDAVRNDRTLTQLGQQQAVQRIEEAYVRNVESLRADAALRLDRDRSVNALALRKARTAAIDAKRQALGDVVLAQIYILRVQALPSEDIQRLYEHSAEGFERALVGELGRAVLESRIRAQGASMADFAAANALQSDVSPQLRTLEAEALELAHGDEFVTQLDVSAARQRVADTYGVGVQYVELA